ncbi:MAG: hypothetical protein R6V35_01195 [Candidatus Nanohaloarchaea archaeon]
MPLFGNNETKDEVESVMMAVEDIKAHMNALDNAVQHHDQELDEIVEALTSEEKISEHVEENAEDVQALKKVFRKFSSIQSNYIERVDVLDSELSETDKDLSRLESRVTRLKKGQDALFDDMENLKDKIEEIESEFILDTNRQEWDIDSKVEASEFEDHKGKVENELSKLRTSLNDLSDKIEEENVEIEKQ